MNRSRGPVWHKKQKDLNIIPKNLRGVDREATWSKSMADGWIYGHGTFCLASHGLPVLGIFQWMPNSRNEAKRMEEEIVKYENIVKKVFMDSKADDQEMYFSLKKNHHIQLVTSPRRNMNKSESRKRMIKDMLTPRNLKDYKDRSVTVEPMQGLMKDIFELDKCWMRGNANNRWLFAAMGVAVQIAQSNVLKNKQSTWKIKSYVLGV